MEILLRVSENFLSDSKLLDPDIINYCKWDVESMFKISRWSEKNVS